jgi:hypothetical protein
VCPSWRGDNLEVFYCLSAFEVWLDKRVFFGKGVRVIVFNATINNVSTISWQTVLFVEETRVPAENH